MTSALLSYEDLQALLETNQEALVLLDATFVLPNSPVDPQLVFRNKRIGETQYFDVDKVADTSSSLPHMMPTPEFFAECVGAMGIANDTKVVIYGQDGIALGPARAWWMFRAFGHENVFILNGSLCDWEANGLPIETTQPIIPQAMTYQAAFDPSCVVTMDQVMDISLQKAAPIYDARPKERFDGIAPEPRAGMRGGHIPNSCCLPAGSLIDPTTGGLKSVEELRGIISEECLQEGPAPVMTCGSGVTACLIGLAFYELGRHDFRIYDGSWSEWGMSDRPVEAA